MHLAELADVPDGEVDGLVKPGRGDFGGREALLQRKQTLGDLGRDVSMMHRRSWG